MIGSKLSIILLSISIALLFFILAYIIVYAISADKIAAEKRVEEINKKEGDGLDVALVKNETINEKKKKQQRKQSKFSEKVAAEIYDQLQAADIQMRPEEFLLIWILVAFVPAALAALFVSDTTVTVVLVIVGVLLPFFIIKMKKKSRVKKFEAQLSDALMLACSSLKSGLSFNQAMESIARDMEAPISTEFSTVLREINMGYSMDEAMDNLNKRISSPYVSLMVSAVLVQRQTGGNLSKILENIADTIKKKFKLKKQLKSATSGGKMSGIIVGAMPFLLLFLFIAVNPDIYKMVLTESRGHVLLYVAIGLEVCAFTMIKKICTIKI